MPAFRTLDDADLAGKRVLVRVDLNVPMEEGRVTDTTRIDRILPTIREIAQKGGKVILLAHFGRPKGRDEKNSLRQVVPALAHALGQPVIFVGDCIGEEAPKAIAAAKNGEILLLENTRFHAGDETNDPEFIVSVPEPPPSKSLPMFSVNSTTTRPPSFTVCWRLGTFAAHSMFPSGSMLMAMISEWLLEVSMSFN